MKNKLENFLTDHRLIKRPRPVLPIILSIIAVVAIALIIILTPLLVNGYGIYRQVKSLDERANLILADASGGDLKNISLDLAAVSDDLLLIKTQAKKLGLILYWPSIGKTSRTMDQMLGASINLVDGYRQLLGVFADLENTTAEGKVALNFSTPEGRKMVLQSIINNRSVLEKAKLKIMAAKLELSAINSDDLTGIFRTKIVKANQLLSEVIGQSELALPLFKYLPELAGAGREKNYLILFQNNMELRPTGGFIGSYGVVTVKNGEIISIYTDDIYNLDKLSKDKLTLPAPWPMTVYNGQKYLFLRDANWSPDWPTSAKQIQWFWDTERANANLPPLKLDGIIAITPDFIANFLDLTGPITEDGITFTSQNFALALEQAVEFDFAAKGIPLAERKSIIGDLAREIMSRLMKSSPKDLLKLWAVIKKDIEEKQIIVYLSDPELENYIMSENWSGQIRSAEDDYLYVVDANLAALKTDSVMKREINYSIALDANNDLIGKVAITYRHTGKPVPALITKYRTYTRVYVPAGTWFNKVYLQDNKGTQNLALLKDVAIADEFDKRYAGVFLTVEPGESKTLVLEYRLPEEVNKMYQSGLYKLIVQKQPGTTGHKLKIDLKFDRLITAYHADNLPAKFLGRNLVFDTDLRTDREFTVKF